MTWLPNAVKCSNCEIPRREVNKWFCLLPIPVPATIEMLQGHETSYRADVGVGIFPWNDDLAKAKNAAHGCGHDCAFQMASRFLATGKFERQPAGAARKEPQHKEPGAGVSEGSVGSGNPAIP